MASTHSATENLASRRAFSSVQLQRGYFDFKNNRRGKRGHKWQISIPSHLHSQDVEQMEAEAVQSVGVGRRFDERRSGADDGDHQHQGGKRGPVGDRMGKNKSSPMVQRATSSRRFSLLWFTWRFQKQWLLGTNVMLMVKLGALKNQHQCTKNRCQSFSGVH